LTVVTVAVLNPGMPVPDFIRQQNTQIATLCRRHHARRLELFGSATRADFDPVRSDLDFLVDLPDDLPPGGYAEAFFALKQGLEALFERPVDLLSRTQIVNPHLQRRVDSERVVVYGT
jgi:predicted nucleotidyltransferase